jgi:alpha-L-fucosidase 2
MLAMAVVSRFAIGLASALVVAGVLRSSAGGPLPSPTEPGCPPLVVGNPDGNYIAPGVKGAIAYRGEGATALRLDAFVPPGARGRPVTVVVHGGNYTAGSRVAHVGQLLELFSDAALPWVSVDYRLGGPDRRSEAADDVGAAVAFVRCQAAALGVDADRVVLVGEDTGAEIAMMLLQRGTPGVVAAAFVGGRFEPGVLAGRRPGASLLFVHGDADDEQPIAGVRDRCRAEVSSERCQRLEVAGGIHRSENWRPSQWGYKEPLVRWIEAHGRSPRTPETLAAARPPNLPWPAGPLPKGLHKRLAWDEAHGLTLDAWVPGGGADRPLALLVHGGGWEAGDRVTYITPLFAPLARAGIAWVSIDYRLTPGVDHGGQLDDLRRAVRFVHEHAATLGADPSRIALVGESASAQMATLVAAEDRGLPIAAVVSFYGVYDFEPMVTDAGPRSLVARLFGRHALDDESRRLLRDASPIHRARAGMPPLLLVHGTAESLWAQAVAYEARLTALGVPHDLVRLDGAPHGMENWEGRAEWGSCMDAVVAFISGARATQEARDEASGGRARRSLDLQSRPRQPPASDPSPRAWSTIRPGPRSRP